MGGELLIALAALSAAGRGARLNLRMPRGRKPAPEPRLRAALHDAQRDATLQVANGWQPWYLDTGGPTSVNARPEYLPAPAARVRSGSAAQEYNTFFATHTAGVYQRVPVTAGTELRFSVWMWVWSSATFDDPNVSADPNDVRVSVGIDPTGGVSAESRTSSGRRK